MIPFATTAEVKPIEGTIAQDRALEALQMGIENNAPGFNIFVSGLTGTGRSTTVESILRQISPQCRIAPDRAFVHNFEDPDRPRLLSFARGQAVNFAAEMKRLARLLVENVPQIFESKAFEERKEQIVKGNVEGSRDRFKDLDRQLKENHLAMVEVTVGEVTRPEIVIKAREQVYPIAALETLVAEKVFTEEEAKKMAAAHETIGAQLAEMLKATRVAMREVGAQLEQLVRELGAVLLDGPFEDLKERFKDEKIHSYLDQVREFVLANLGAFQPPETGSPLAPSGSGGEPPLPLELAVNVILDNSNLNECPIIMEPRPTYKNLFGVIERTVDASGQTQTDFTRIHAGSLLRADGGALILNVNDLLHDTWVWPTLKNVLRFHQLEIANPPQIFALGSDALTPEPIPVDVKVVLIGDHETYQLLSTYDSEFEKTFKVLAHFDSEMDATQANIGHFAGLVARIIEEEGMLHLERSGFSELLEHSMRRSGRRGKLSTRFGDLADLLREASYYGRKEGKKVIDEGTLFHAIQAQKRRHSLVEEKLSEFITNDMILISTQGKEVGQINGVAVYDMRAYRFGKPSRLTVSTGVGGAGLINIERESGLSGQTHDKGVLILAGYMRSKYARFVPLAFSASIAFEQSYGMIDGDSASSTELYALLSDLADAPIDQGYAVTGSVNQRGEIQAIGGANEKVEAWYDLCAERGLTGTQGILIPHQNVPDLQLRQDLVDAVAIGKFHVYAIETIDQGIEILTRFPASQIHDRVTARLRQYHNAFSGRPTETPSVTILEPPQTDCPPPPPPPAPPAPPTPPSPRDPREPG